MITQLNPPLPIWIPEQGRSALAHLVIDYGMECDLIWVCFVDNGEIWSLPNPRVRAQWNITMDRKPIHEMPPYEA